MIELMLLSAILASRDASALSRLGLNDAMKWYTHKDAYLYIQKHLDEFGELPSLTSVLENVDNFEVVEVVESIDTLASKLHERNLKVAERRFMEETAKAWDSLSAYDIVEKFEKAVEEFKAVSGYRGREGVDWTQSASSRLKEYERRKTHVFSRQCPWLFEEMNAALGKINVGAYITFMGFTKRGKTWLGLLQALRAHEAGLTVLYESGEMNKEEVQFRLDTLAAGFSNRALLTGSLDFHSEETYKAWLATHKESSPLFIKTTEDWPRGLTLSQIQRDIELLHPDVVIIDQFSLIRHVTPDRVGMTNTSRRLKELAGKLGVVLVNLYQTNGEYERGKKHEKTEDGIRILDPPTASNYSETIAVIQDSDVLITFDTVQWLDEQTKHKYGKGLVRVELSRNGGEGTEIEFNWIPDLGVIEPKKPMDMF